MYGVDVVDHRVLALRTLENNDMKLVAALVSSVKYVGRRFVFRTATSLVVTQVCAISNEVLREPVAACQLGYLYNKVSTSRLKSCSKNMDGELH